MAHDDTTDEHPFVQKLRDAQATKDADAAPLEIRDVPLPEGSARVYFDAPKRSK